jgi:hypothetical protein
MSPNPRIVFAVFVSALAAGPAFAAPFCVQTQSLPAECAYFDPSQCRVRAAQLSGFCVANPAELVIRSGETSAYCLVLSNRSAECVYADRTSCESEAVSANGVCIEQSSFNVAKNPYLLDINRKY